MRAKNCIELDKCVDGKLYRIQSRNLTHGIFTKKNNGFLGVRVKFGHRYLFTEYHWDTGAPFGTASPLEDLGVCPVQGDMSEDNKDLFNWLEEHYTGDEKDRV